MAVLNYEQVSLQEIAAGDERAFRALFDQYRGRLFHYISRFIKSEQVAEELVLDVFMKIWTGRELLTQVQHFDAFLFRVAHNKAIDFLRSAANDAHLRELLWEEIQAASGDLPD
ncbi:MAG TPA: sigma factor, partial [Chitinophaga sp.]|uniref:RNA polymerase sigma factor n=1 Tax=Chitinophaga sp. TaxID=1869181 RepID=UPI002C36EC07